MLSKLRVSPEQVARGAVLSTLIKLAIPTAIALSLNAAFNFADRFYLAQIGEEVFAAIGIAFILQASIASIAQGLASGINATLSKALGAEDRQRADILVKWAILLTIIASVLTSAIGLALLPSLLDWMRVSEAMQVHVSLYLHIVFAGSVVIYAPIMFNAILRAQGNMITPMQVMIVGASMNLVLDPLLIFGLSVIPAMGVKGAAIATLLARACAVVWVVRALTGPLNGLPIKWAPRLWLSSTLALFEQHRRELGKVLNIGLPAAAANLAYPAVLGVYYSLLADYGDAAKVAFTLGLTYGLLVEFPVAGICRGLLTLASHSLGAKQIDRMRQIFNTGLITVLVLSLSLSAILVLGREFFIALFTTDTSHQSLNEWALICFAASFPLVGLANLQVAYLQAMQRGMPSMMVKVVQLCAPLFSLALATLMNGLTGIWIGYLLSCAMSCILGFLLSLYYSKTLNANA